jgi:hypothetical protein
MRERHRRGLFHNPQYFTAKEIEVFKITHYTALPADHEKWVIGVCSKRWPEAPLVGGRGMSPGAPGTQAGDIALGKATSLCYSEICFRKSAGFSTQTMSDSHNDRK